MFKFILVKSVAAIQVYMSTPVRSSLSFLQLSELWDAPETCPFYRGCCSMLPCFLLSLSDLETCLRSFVNSAA